MINGVVEVGSIEERRGVKLQPSWRTWPLLWSNLEQFVPARAALFTLAEAVACLDINHQHLRVHRVASSHAFILYIMQFANVARRIMRYLGDITVGRLVFVSRAMR